MLTGGRLFPNGIPSGKTKSDVIEALTAALWAVESASKGKKERSVDYKPAALSAWEIYGPFGDNCGHMASSAIVKNEATQNDGIDDAEPPPQNTGRKKQKTHKAEAALESLKKCAADLGDDLEKFFLSAIQVLVKSRGSIPCEMDAIMRRSNAPGKAQVRKNHFRFYEFRSIYRWMHVFIVCTLNNKTSPFMIKSRKRWDRNS